MSTEDPRATTPARAPDRPPSPAPDDVVLLEDLAPQRDVEGGRKITLGESVPEK